MSKRKTYCELNAEVLMEALGITEEKKDWLDWLILVLQNVHSDGVIKGMERSKELLGHND